MGLQSLLILTLLGATPAAVGQEIVPIGAGMVRADTLAPGDYTHEDASYFDCFQLQGSPGDRIVISMTSDDFDSLLLATNGETCAVDNPIGSDDDGGGGLNARLAVTLQPGANWLRATSAGSGAKSGRYVIDTSRARE